MRRILLLLVLLIPTTVFAQLSDDQEALLENVQRSMEAQANWTRYQQSTERTTNTAITVTGEERVYWATSNTTLESALAFDIPDDAIVGEASFSVTAADAENGMSNFENAIEIDIDATDTSLAVDSEAFPGFADAAAVANFDIDVLLSSDVEELLTMLDDTVAIFDLGVTERPDTTVQRYELELELTEANANRIGLDLEVFADAFAEDVEAETLVDTLLENGVLRLEVLLDVQTGRLLGTDLLLDMRAELTDDDVISAEDGLFILEFVQSVRTVYFDVETE